MNPEAAAAGEVVALEGRPERALPTRQLLQISVYWLGLTSVFAALDTVVLPERLTPLLGQATVGLAIGVISLLGTLVAIVVQPTAGALSDYTVTRWGRRKPYLVVGSTLDLVFLVGIATSRPVLAIAACYLLLQVSSNIAQGPFQGYVPDLVPARQVGAASALVGIMSVAGPVLGTVLVSLPLAATPAGASPDFTLATVTLGVVELGTALLTVLTVDEGRGARDRAGRSWLAVALGAWHRDVLGERSFVWLVASRLCILAGVGMFTREIDLFMQFALRLDPAERGFWLRLAPLVLGAAVILAALPAARLSDRHGRKAVIYAACGLGSLGSGLMVVAPGVPLVLVAGLAIGVGAGAFLAVDWALMTDIIPKAEAGRFMGLSNVATALSGTLAVLAGGAVVYLAVGLAGSSALGIRLAYLLGVVLFAAGAAALRPVDPTRREAYPGAR